MARLDHVFETVLALTGLALTVNIGYAVVAWLYAALFVGGSVLAYLLALVFIGFGTVIVVGFVGLYWPRGGR
jgi:hypothetical protein